MVCVKDRWYGSTHSHGHRVIQDTNTPATFWQKTTANKRQLALSLIRENEIKYTICRTQSSVTRTLIYICDIKTTNVARTITESAMVQYSCVQIKKIFNTYIKYFTTTTTTTTTSLFSIHVAHNNELVRSLFFPIFDFNFVLLLCFHKSFVRITGFVRFHRFLVSRLLAGESIEKGLLFGLTQLVPLRSS